MVSTITGKKTLFSGFTNVHCNLLFSTERLVVQRTQSQLRRSVPDYRAPSGLGELPIETILKSDPGNFFIPYAEIISVEIGRKWLNPRMNVRSKERVDRFMWVWPYVGLGHIARAARALFPPSVPVSRVTNITE